MPEIKITKQREEADKQQMEERVLNVSRQMLAGCQNKIICQKMSVEWDISERQIKRYISKAYTMWRMEYKKRLKAGMNYHMAIRMKLYEEAYKGNTIKITKVARGKVVTLERTEDQDFRLCLEVAKDIAKLEGLYIEKREVGPPGSFAEWVKAVKKEKERRQKKNPDSNR